MGEDSFKGPMTPSGDFRGRRLIFRLYEHSRFPKFRQAAQVLDTRGINRSMSVPNLLEHLQAFLRQLVFGINGEGAMEMRFGGIVVLQFRQHGCVLGFGVVGPMIDDPREFLGGLRIDGVSGKIESELRVGEGREDEACRDVFSRRCSP